MVESKNVKKRKKVVIVEDDEDLLPLLIAAFQAQGFDVHGIVNGKEASDYLMEETNLDSLSLIILDRFLPDMDGIEILKQFINKFHNQVPVLIFSILSSEKDVIEGFKYGAVDYVTKPFSLPILMSKALSLISR